MSKSINHQDSQNRQFSEQLDHVFRHEYGLLVASLGKRVGLTHLSLIEDAVQDAMQAALISWPMHGKPHATGAWLYQVAYRKLMSEFRRKTSQTSLLIQEAQQLEDLQDSSLEQDLDVPLANEMQDNMLALLFVSSDQGIPANSQLIFTLKSLCGFSIKEIAQRLFITEANVYKRFQRAKARLKHANLEIESLSNTELEKRLSNVFNVLYLIFTEGYLSSHPDQAIRLDLCEEAIHLTTVLSQHTIGNKAETFALLALMYFHLARMMSRKAPCGALVLLAEQDRTLWNQGHIQTAMEYLLKSAQGKKVSRFHLEANIAAEHCLAPSIKATNWQNIIDTYERLESLTSSPILGLNRVIALSYHTGPESALILLNQLPTPTWLSTSYHYYAVKADLLYQADQHELAQTEADRAIECAPTKSIKQLLETRFSTYR